MLDLLVKVLASEFFLGIISGALLSIFGHWVSQIWWLKNQVWLSRRDIYVEMLEKAARFFDLSRQLRSCYLALDQVAASRKIAERDPLLLDLSQLTVRAALILQNDEALQALNNVVGAQTSMAGQVNAKLDSLPKPKPLKDVCEILAWGMEQQANAAANSIRMIHRVALSDLRLKKDIFALPEKWNIGDNDVIQLQLSTQSVGRKGDEEN